MKMWLCRFWTVPRTGTDDLSLSFPLAQDNTKKPKPPTPYPTKNQMNKQTKYKTHHFILLYASFTSGWWKILTGLLHGFPLWTVYVFFKSVFKNFSQIPIEYFTQTRRVRKEYSLVLGPHIFDNQLILRYAELYDKNFTLTSFFYTWFSEEDYKKQTASGFQWFPSWWMSITLSKIALSDQ